MNYLKILSYATMMLTIGTANCQDLSSHQWKGRLVLVLFDSVSIATYQDQIKQFQENENGLNERKLIIYHINPKEYKRGLLNSNWQRSKRLFNQYKKTDTHFEIILIGLDGGIKWRQSEFVSCKELFAVIDVMPMRRAELNKKEKRN